VSEQFIAKVGEFAGPIEVLLRLIEEKKLHISQVSLASVADDFISYLQKLNNQGEASVNDELACCNSNKAEIANFILVASTLMLIKSLALLPTLEVTTEEKEGIEDLERRLRLYQRMKDLSVHIKERFGRQIIFTRELSREITPVFAPTAEITPAGIWQAIKNLITNFPQPEKIPEVIIKKVISLEEVITNLTNRVQSALQMSFKQFVGNQKEKVNIIVSFLGMLELVKRGIISVEQQNHFEDIHMETGGIDTPRY
jgi:segregation and condensation protein A